MKADWPLAESFTSYLKPSLSLKELRVLREFYMAQQALAVELREAKPLGICKTTTSPSEGFNTHLKYFKEDLKEIL